MSNDAPSASPKLRNRPPIYRRQFIVDKPFQYRLMGTLLAIWFANSLFFSMVLYFFYEGHLNQFYELVPRPGMLPLLTLPTLFSVAIGFVAVFGIIVLGVVGLYMSNQIAGPLFRTKKCMERIAAGDWNFLLRFREGDFMTDFPPAFNSMLEGLRAIAASDVEELKAIEACGSDDAELKRLVRQLRERKEAQMGQSPPIPTDEEDEREPVSVAVH
jgi:methyl-accepting chemotaxis protein